MPKDVLEVWALLVAFEGVSGFRRQHHICFINRHKQLAPGNSNSTD